jgi:hypothetical protein
MAALVDKKNPPKKKKAAPKKEAPVNTELEDDLDDECPF